MKQKIGECRYCGSRQWVTKGVCERCSEELKAERGDDPLWFILWILAFILIVVGVLGYSMFYVLTHLTGQ